MKVAALAGSIFWLVIPSLILFISLPLLLRHGVNFYLSLALSIGLTVCGYWLMISLLKKWVFSYGHLLLNNPPTLWRFSFQGFYFISHGWLLKVAKADFRALAKCVVETTPQ
jgi:hypothetical protein